MPVMPDLLFERLLACCVLLLPLSAQVPLARLEGETTDALQQPLADCYVTVEVDGEVLAHTHSDASGAFRFAALPQAHVVVRAIAGADAGAVAVDLAGIDAGHAQVALWPTRTLRGVVRDAEGAAVAGAWVAATPSDAAELALLDAVAQCDADGRYELVHVLAGPVAVLAWAPRHNGCEGSVAGAVDAVLDCRLGAGAGHENRFVLNGATAQQLGRALLRLSATGARGVAIALPPPLRQLRPDADGSCVLAGLPRTWTVTGRFVVPEAVVVPPWASPAGGVHTCDFAVEPVAESGIIGVLQDRDGGPLANRLLLCRPCDDTAAAFATVFGWTADDGRFALPAPVPPGERFAVRVVDPQLAVAHERSRFSGSRSWYVARHRPEDEHDVPAAPATALAFRVVDAAGAPVRGVAATLRQLGKVLGPILGTGSSDAEGRVSFTGIDLTGIGRVRIELCGNGGVASRDCEIGEVPGRVTVTPPAILSGRVLHDDGSAVVGARIRLAAGELVLSDRGGRFRFPGLPSGPQRLSVAVDGKPWLRSREVELLAGQRCDVSLRRDR